MAVEKLSEVRSVETDMTEHTLTVEFDDDDLSIEEIISTLNEAGYTVPDYEKQASS